MLLYSGQRGEVGQESDYKYHGNPYIYRVLYTIPCDKLGHMLDLIIIGAYSLGGGAWVRLYQVYCAQKYFCAEPTFRVVYLEHVMCILL